MKKIWYFLLVIYSFCFASTDSFYFYDSETFQSSVYIETIGDPKKPAVIFVHGLGDEASSIWKETKESLKDEYFVLIFDLPGFRNSEMSKNLYSPENYARLINTIARNFVYKPFHLVGHSMGGAISLKYASMYEETLLSLVLIDAAGILHRSTYSKFLTFNGIDKFFDSQDGIGRLFQSQRVSSFINTITEKIDNKMTLDVDNILASSHLRSSILRNNTTTISALALVQTDFSNIVENINTNTLIIWGEDDSVAPVQTGYVLNKLLPNSKMEIIPQCGHVPIISHKDIYLSLLKTHLQNSETYITTKAEINGLPRIVTVQNANKEVISGYIKKATITNSNNILIKDAIIDELEIINSNVEILNSTFSGLERFITQNSTLFIIASDITGNILVNNSTINIAGTSFNGETKNIQQGLRTSTIIYSLSKHNGQNIHGRFILDNQDNKILQ
jgi:pimeloyl-ACP methyl ester carboxylesterase